MRLITFEYERTQGFGLVLGDGIVDLQKKMGLFSLKELLESGRLDEVGEFANAIPDYQLDQVSFLPVIVDPAHIYCLAINYLDHVNEIANIGIHRDPPKHPAVFVRYADSLIGHRQALVKPAVSDDFDYEAELAVVIGKAGRSIPEAQAMEYVAGYTAFNDASVRDWQFHTRQIAPGKNFAATGALGPWLVTKDEIPDPDNLRVTTRLNGELLQDGNTRDMIHKIPAFISYVSTILPLKPGDVLATGTPSGVGFSRRPPLFMKAGDVVDVEVEGVGILSNPVVAG